LNINYLRLKTKIKIIPKKIRYQPNILNVGVFRYSMKNLTTINPEKKENKTSPNDWLYIIKNCRKILNVGFLKIKNASRNYS